MVATEVIGQLLVDPCLVDVDRGSVAVGDELGEFAGRSGEGDRGGLLADVGEDLVQDLCPCFDEGLGVVGMVG